MPPTSGAYQRADTLQFCSALVTAHGLGLAKDSLVVDVGADAMTEARVSRGFGHPVISFECRGKLAEALGKQKHIYDDSKMKLVHACVAERSRLATLFRAIDSSSMTKARVEGDAELWKHKQEARGNTASESVAAVSLDDALRAESFSALGWPQMRASHVGFIKIDVQGLEEAVLRGAVHTLRMHAPFLYYEDSMLPQADRGGALLDRLLSGERRMYSCECRNDCFCKPRGGGARAGGHNASNHAHPGRGGVRAKAQKKKWDSTAAVVTAHV